MNSESDFSSHEAVRLIGRLLDHRTCIYSVAGDSSCEDCVSCNARLGAAAFLGRHNDIVWEAHDAAV